MSRRARGRRAAPSRPARSSRSASRGSKAPARRARAEQPLGVGVADAFAVARLKVPVRLTRARKEKGVREVGWAEFGELARDLAERVGAAFQPDVVLAVVNGGVFPGGALAAALRAELRPVRTTKREERVAVERLGDLRDRTVLVVDDVTVSGQTLAAVRGAALRAGAREVRTAAIVKRPDRPGPDFHALETHDLVVFGWDYQLQGGGSGGDPGEVGV